MADIKCSKCGNVAQPGGFLGKDYKKWDGEIVCDSCYTQLTKATIEERETKEQAEQSAVNAVMNSSDEKNTVATILQVYAIVNRFGSNPFFRYSGNGGLYAYCGSGIFYRSDRREFPHLLFR